MFPQLLAEDIILFYFFCLIGKVLNAKSWVCIFNSMTGRKPREGFELAGARAIPEPGMSVGQMRVELETGTETPITETRT